MKKILCLIFALILTASCATLTTTKQDPVLIPEFMETQFGLQTVIQVELKYRAYPDNRVQDYVKKMGQALVPFCERPGLKYNFKVVDSKVINAFAVPGGFVYVTSALIKNMDDEAQLACVIGHEIGHIARYHSVKQLQRSLVAQYGISVLENMLGSGDKTEIAKMAAGLGLNFLFLKNSRENEFEADEQGAFVAAKAGYDPLAMVDVQNHLLKLRGAKPTQLEQMLSTHPISEERIEHVNSYIKSAGLSASGRNKEAYAALKAAIK